GLLGESGIAKVKNRNGGKNPERRHKNLFRCTAFYPGKTRTKTQPIRDNNPAESAGLSAAKSAGIKYANAAKSAGLCGRICRSSAAKSAGLYKEHTSRTYQ